MEKNEGSQRHHFIPRFILRNFKAEQQPPAGPIQTPQKAKSKAQKRDFLVNKIDLSIQQTTQRPISQENAVKNLYRDSSFIDNPYHLEEKFGRLEQQAAEILQEACKTFSRNETLVLSRQRKDVLRKFLFLMKYRNKGFFERFNHDTISGYERYDKEDLMKYMKEKGFKSPRDVWFYNLRVFLDIELDVDNQWIDCIKKQAYPEDAELFEVHVRNQFITFCQPEWPQDEFILTENAYGVFEGPSSFNNDQWDSIIATEYHNFAPVSPKLMIVLRSCLLASPTEEGAPEVAAEHELWNAIHRNIHACPEEATSILHDLPIKRCTNSYSQQMQSSPKLSIQDAFFFQCFRLSSAHVHLINEIFLEEAWKSSSIIYRSETSLRIALETYFADADERHDFKVIRSPKDRRQPLLETLVKVLKGLGSNTRPVTRINMDQTHLTPTQQEGLGRWPENPAESDLRIQALNIEIVEELKRLQKAKAAPEAQANDSENGDNSTIHSCISLAPTQASPQGQFREPLENPAKSNPRIQSGNLNRAMIEELKRLHRAAPEVQANGNKNGNNSTIDSCVPLPPTPQERPWKSLENPVESGPGIQLGELNRAMVEELKSRQKARAAPEVQADGNENGDKSGIYLVVVSLLVAGLSVYLITVLARWLDYCAEYTLTLIVDRVRGN